jgi:hypothetical protein
MGVKQYSFLLKLLKDLPYMMSLCLSKVLLHTPVDIVTIDCAATVWRLRETVSSLRYAGMPKREVL